MSSRVSSPSCCCRSTACLRRLLPPPPPNRPAGLLEPPPSLGPAPTRPVSRRLPAAAEVNSLVSSETEMPYRYYDMPFCKPPEGVHRATSTINPGTILLGIRIESSPYNFTIMVCQACGCQACGRRRAGGRAGARPPQHNAACPPLRRRVPPPHVQTKQQGQTVCNGPEYPDHAYPALDKMGVKVGAWGSPCGPAGARPQTGSAAAAAACCVLVRCRLWHGLPCVPPPTCTRLPPRPPPRQMLQDKIRQQYRVRLILDNLPITTYDLEQDPESGEGLVCHAAGWCGFTTGLAGGGVRCLAGPAASSAAHVAGAAVLGACSGPPPAACRRAHAHAAPPLRSAPRVRGGL